MLNERRNGSCNSKPVCIVWAEEEEGGVQEREGECKERERMRGEERRSRWIGGWRREGRRGDGEEWKGRKDKRRGRREGMVRSDMRVRRGRGKGG